MGFDIKRTCEQLILNAVGATKVVVNFGIPPVSIEFDKEAFLEMTRSPQLASRAIAKCFVRRRIFHGDLSKENHEFVIKSLEEVEAILDKCDHEITSSGDLAAIATAQIIRAWNNRVVHTRQTLIADITVINKNKGADPFYDTAGEDRFEATRDALIDLRVQTYPLISLLTAFIEDGDVTKSDAKVRYDEGLKMLSSVQANKLGADIEVV